MDDGDDATATSMTIDERVPQAMRRAPHTGGRYELGSELGHGGMGEVFLAHDEQIGREVAIKRMRHRDPNERAVARFLREARIQARLEHPSIVPVHEIGRDADGLPFFVMKRLAGTTLGDIIHDTPEAEYPRQRLLRAFADVCLAVELAHTRGVIHRDLKPANIMLGDFGEVYVLDWGVAKVLGESDLEVPVPPSGEALATVAGTAIGTRGYMAPEQAVGVADIDARADIYSLGCVLFEILTRQELGTERLYDSPAKRCPELDIPPELDTLCRMAIEVDRERRTTSARELGEAVQLFLDGDRDIAMRREMAREHLTRATSAIEHGDDEVTRRNAMRDAGRALAFDPTLRGAGELIGRLMVSPPPVMPREVEVEIARDERKQLRDQGRSAILTYLTLLCGVPYWFATLPLGYATTLAIAVAACIACAVLTWRDRIIPFGILSVSLGGIVALFGITYSPLLIAPGFAALVGTALVLDPRAARPGTIFWLIGVLLVGVFGPWIAEAAGVLPTSMRVDGSGLHLDTPGLRADGTLMAAYAIASVLALIGASVFLSYRSLQAMRELRRKLYLQAWQLRQLVAE